MSSPFTNDTIPSTITDKQRRMLLVFRQCLLMALGALEEYLEIPRSVEPKHKRKAA